MAFEKATREKSRLRMGLSGPPGSGKSYSALRFAFALGKRVAAIETEHRSLAKYAGDAPDGTPFEFDMECLRKYSPSDYTSAIESAGRAGYDVLIIDSLSHAWEGAEGALELVNKKGGNSYTAWKDVTPMHRKMVEAILASPCHVIATMRSKVEHVLEDGVSPSGKAIKIPRKIGMAPIQRPGMEYEFDVFADLDWSHILTVTKSRCPAIDGAIIAKPGPAFMEQVVAWLNGGVAARPSTFTVRPQLAPGVVQALVDAAVAAGVMPEKLRDECMTRYSFRELADLTGEQAQDLFERLKKRRKVTGATTTVAAAQAAPAANGNGNGHAQHHEPTASQATPPAAALAAPTTSVPAEQPAAPGGRSAKPGCATTDQLVRIGTLRGQLFATFPVNTTDEARREAWAGILLRRGVTTAYDLLPAVADELIKTITTKLFKEEAVPQMEEAFRGGSAP